MDSTDLDFDDGPPPLPSSGTLPLGSMLRREQQRLKVKRLQSSSTASGGTLNRIIYIAFYLYMARLGFTCISLFPGGLGLVVQTIYSHYYHILTRRDAYPPLLQELDWAAMLTQRSGGIDAAVKSLRMRALPVVIRNAPFLSEKEVLAALRDLYARSNYSYSSRNADAFDDDNTVRAQRDGNNVFYRAYRRGAWEGAHNTYVPSVTDGAPRLLPTQEAGQLFRSDALLRTRGSCDKRGRGVRGYWQWRLAIADLASAPTAAMALSAPLTELLAAAIHQYPKSSPDTPALAPAELLLTGGYNASEHTRFEPSERFVIQLAGSRALEIAPPAVLDRHSPPPSAHRMHGHGAYASVAAAASCIASTLGLGTTDSPDAPLWEVLLRPGDLLYLPAHFLYSSAHASESPCSSLHISAAPPGAAAAEMRYALRKVQLPFAATDSRGAQLASLGSMARSVLLQWGHSCDDFAAAFEQRVRGSLAEGGLPLVLRAACTSAPLCSSLHRRLAAQSSSRHLTAARQLLNVFTRRAPYAPPALRRLLLFEYVEAVIHEEVLASEPAGPCLLLDFVRSCLLARG